MIDTGKVTPRTISKGAAFVFALALAGNAAALELRGSVPAPGQPIGDVAVNPATDQVYLGGGMAQAFMTVIDASDPDNPAVVTTISGANGGSGVAVNPNTNRFYTSDAFGGKIKVYDGATNGFIKDIAIGFCPGSFDIDVTTELIYVTAQCGASNDPLHVIDGVTDTLAAGPIGTGGVVGAVRLNAATGRAYTCTSGSARIFGPSPGFADLGTIAGECVQDANPVTNRLYLSSGGDTVVRDGATEGLIVTIAGVAGTAAVNTDRDRLYVLDNLGEAINVIDGQSNTVVETFALPAGMSPKVLAVDSSKNRLYVSAFDVNNIPTLLIIDDPLPKDHLLCYQAKIPNQAPDFVPFPVELADQFHPPLETGKIVVLPVAVCTPVDKNGEGIVDPDTHMVCYLIRDASGGSAPAQVPVRMANQFGEQILVVGAPRLLCVPSTKEIIEP